MNDTDHLWGMGGDRGWVWKSFLRGLNPIYMDPYDEDAHQTYFESLGKSRDDTIQAMGYTLAFATRINLASMAPHEAMCSTTYCLVNPGKDYLVYLPSDAGSNGMVETITIDLSASSGPLSVEWFHPRTGQTFTGGMTLGGGHRHFTAPFGGDAVLYLTTDDGHQPR